MQVHGGHRRSNHSRSFQGVCVQNLVKRLATGRMIDVVASLAADVALEFRAVLGGDDAILQVVVARWEVVS